MAKHYSSVAAAVPALAAALLALLAPGSAAQASRTEIIRFTHPSPQGVAGYRLYVGETSGRYDSVYDLGPETLAPNEVATLQLPFAVPDHARLFVTLSAYDVAGRESRPSNELLLVPAGVRGPQDGIADDGDGSGRIGDAPCSDGETAGCDDNCPLTPNGPAAGTCLTGYAYRLGRVCTRHRECGRGGYCSQAQEDSDADGVGDVCDVCSLAADPAQLDSDEDGYGNACDADFDGDGVVSVLDGGLWVSAWREPPPHPASMDLDGDGALTAADWLTLRDWIGQSPGPSGLACAGDVPCWSGACPFAIRDTDGDGMGDACDR